VGRQLLRILVRNETAQTTTETRGKATPRERRTKSRGAVLPSKLGLENCKQHQSNYKDHLNERRAQTALAALGPSRDEEPLQSYARKVPPTLILKQQYYEGTFDSIAEPVAEYGELLDTNRSKCERIRKNASSQDHLHLHCTARGTAGLPPWGHRDR
jgi:hypothetical protein